MHSTSSLSTAKQLALLLYNTVSDRQLYNVTILTQTWQKSQVVLTSGTCSTRFRSKTFWPTDIFTVDSLLVLSFIMWFQAVEIVALDRISLPAEKDLSCIICAMALEYTEVVWLVVSAKYVDSLSSFQSNFRIIELSSLSFSPSSLTLLRFLLFHSDWTWPGSQQYQHSKPFSSVFLLISLYFYFFCCTTKSFPWPAHPSTLKTAMKHISTANIEVQTTRWGRPLLAT